MGLVLSKNVRKIPYTALISALMTEIECRISELTSIMKNEEYERCNKMMKCTNCQPKISNSTSIW